MNRRYSARRLALLLLLLSSVVAGLCAPTLVKPQVAQAANEDDQLSKVQQAEDQKQAELDAAKVADDDLERQISEISDQIAAQRPKVVTARKRLEIANSELQKAEEQLNAKENELRTSQTALERHAVALYKSASVGGAEAYIGSESINQAELRLAAFRSMLKDEQRVVESLTSARNDLEEDRQKVAAKHAEAETAHAVAQDELRRLSKLEAAKKASEKELQKRIKDLEGEIAALAAEEDKIRATIAAQMGIAESSLVGRSSAPGKRGMIWPTQGTLTSRFGQRWGRLHAGIDIATSTGTPIKAAATGQVISAGWSGGYGNLVLIAHGGGIVTAYGHQSQIAVSVGQVVSRGSVIGYVGSTGHSTGPHLHFEVRVDGSPTDPLEWL